MLARDGIVLNPHYKGMGGLYGSEYWTYSLPKRVGADKALQLTEQCLPLSVDEARAIGLIDDIILQDDLGDSPFGRFRDQITRIAEKLSRSPLYGSWLAQKQATREKDERSKPLEHYRLTELEEMKKNFWARIAAITSPEPPSFAISRALATCNVTRPSKSPVAMNSARTPDDSPQTAAYAHLGWSN